MEDILQHGWSELNQGTRNWVQTNVSSSSVGRYQAHSSFIHWAQNPCIAMVATIEIAEPGSIGF